MKEAGEGVAKVGELLLRWTWESSREIGRASCRVCSSLSSGLLPVGTRLHRRASVAPAVQHPPAAAPPAASTVTAHHPQRRRPLRQARRRRNTPQWRPPYVEDANSAAPIAAATPL